MSEKYDSQIKVADSNQSKKYDNDKSKPMALIIFPHTVLVDGNSALIVAKSFAIKVLVAVDLVLIA